MLATDASIRKAEHRTVAFGIILWYNSIKINFTLNLFTSKSNIICETGFNNTKGGTYGTRNFF